VCTILKTVHPLSRASEMSCQKWIIRSSSRSVAPLPAADVVADCN